MKDVYYRSNASHTIEFKNCNNGVNTSKAHFHESLSVGIIEEGSCIAKMNQTRCLPSRTLIVIPSGITHWCRPISYTNWRFQMFYLDLGTLKQLGCSYLNSKILVYENINGRLFNDMIFWFHEFENRLNSPTDTFTNLNTFLNYTGLHRRDSVAQYIAREIPNNINRVRIFLESNYQSSVNGDEIAELAGMNKFELIRQFHSYIGIPPNKYLVNVRIINAKKELCQSLPSIADIAFKNGFYDQSHFDKTFQAYTGVTPIEYRKNVIR
jgi:Transcriptional regulator containing an amidase domain and an AraC-type DNA-binding HTH domain